MKLHPKAIENMKEQLKTVLHDCTIEKQWPVFSSYFDSLLKFAKEALKHRKDWITLLNVYFIFVNHVQAKLSEKILYNKEIDGKLCDILKDEDVQALIGSILSYIESIPRKYLIYFPFPSIEGIGQVNFELARGISVRAYANKEDIPGGYKDGLAGAIVAPNSLEVGKVYIVFEEMGYVGGAVEDIAFLSALSKYKQLMHLGYIRGVFSEKKPKPGTMGLLFSREYIPRINAIVFDESVLDAVNCSISLPRSIAKHVDSFEFYTINKDYIAAKERGVDEIIKFVMSVLRRPATLIAASSEMEEAVAIRTAIEWAFEAAANDNETIAFIQTCIGFEAILGDETGGESLTQTLADRCAYLIGTDIKGRKTIKDYFKELYRLRSKLVHGRAVRLHESEKWYLNWGKSILDQVISKEIKNLNLDNA